MPDCFVIQAEETLEIDFEFIACLRICWKPNPAPRRNWIGDVAGASLKRVTGMKEKVITCTSHRFLTRRIKAIASSLPFHKWSSIKIATIGLPEKLQAPKREVSVVILPVSAFHWWSDLHSTNYFQRPRLPDLAIHFFGASLLEIWKNPFLGVLNGCCSYWLVYSIKSFLIQLKMSFCSLSSGASQENGHLLTWT